MPKEPRQVKLIDIHVGITSFFTSCDEEASDCSIDVYELDLSWLLGQYNNKQECFYLLLHCSRSTTQIHPCWCHFLLASYLVINLASYAKEQ